jgi:small GTP-binding protein
MQIDSDFELQIKMVIIGDSGVGKTNFIFQFTENRFSGLHIATVGFDYKTKIISLPSSKKKVKIQIWDTAGQERYMALNKNIFQKVQGIIIMYDLTKRSTFENLDKWMHVLSQSVSGKVKFLVANKLDKASEQRIVSEEEGQKYADENNMKFFEASGYTGKNVENIFIQMAEMIYENITDDKSAFRSEASIVLAKKDHKKKKKCCK